MDNLNEKAEEIGGATESIAEVKPAKKGMAPKFKKIIIGIVVATAGAGAVYELMTDSTEKVVPQTSLTTDSGFTATEKPEGEAREPVLSDDDTEANDPPLSVRPVVSFLGREIAEDGEPDHEREGTKPNVEPAVVQPIVSTQTQAAQPTASTSEPGPVAKGEFGKQGSATFQDSIATVAFDRESTHNQEELLAQREAETAAYTKPPSNHEQLVSSTRTSSVSAVHQPVYEPANGVHGVFDGVRNSSDPVAENIVGKVIKSKYSGEKVYFVKVAKNLPTKIRLLPDSKTKVVSFLSNHQEWEVKQFGDGVLIVEVKPNATMAPVADLLIQQGDRYYSFTLAATKTAGERDNMVIFEKQ